MICSFLKKEELRLRAERNIRIWEEEEAFAEMEHVLTSELLGTGDYQIVA
jgi:hypothetical protein